MECRDCEEFLAEGIEAFRWLRTAEDIMREGDYQGVFEFTAELQKVLDLLYSAWLVPLEFVENWISSLAARGYTPKNLPKFRKVCEEAEVHRRAPQLAKSSDRHPDFSFNRRKLVK